MSQTPANPTVTLTIDGHAITVPKGTTVYHAAKQLGIEVPIFCYHDRMPPLGACRMCFVKVEKMPRLQTSCTLEATEGMVVETESPDVVEARQGVLEFLLINHPLDCPICDKGGECPLQDNTFKYGPGASQYVEPKRHFMKAIPLSPVLTLDRERCIMCWRCTRFGEVIAGDHALKGHERGFATHIDIPPITMEGPSKFIGNTIEICPVGALTSSAYRFRSRPWDNLGTPSVCTHCGVGCAIRYDARGGEITRVRSRENAEVNDVWTCDVGFFGYDYVNSQDRLSRPLVRRGDTLVETSWDEALNLVATRLRDAGGDHAGAIGGERLTLEESYLLSRLYRSLGSANLDYRADSLAAPDTRDWGWGTEGTMADLDRAGAIVLIGCDLIEEYPVVWLRAKRALDRGALGFAIAPKRLEIDRYLRHNAVVRYGHEALVLLALSKLVAEARGAEAPVEAAALVDLDAAALASRAGVSIEALRAAARDLIAHPPASFHVGRLALDGPDPRAVLLAANTLRAVCGGGALSILRGRGSAAAAAVAGMVPDALPGLAPTDDAAALGRLRTAWGRDIAAKKGLDTPGMLGAAAAGELSFLLVAGADPAADYPDAEAWRLARAGVGFLVVQDVFLTETAKQADVVLPALTHAEKNGTVGSIEARVQRIGQARPGLDGARADATILQAIATRVGVPLMYGSVHEIFEEMTTVIPGLAEGLAFPLPRRTARVEREAIETILASAPASGGGATLVPVTSLFRLGEMTKRSPGLARLAGRPTATVHPLDAARWGIANGDEVEVAFDGRTARLFARVTDETREGQILVPRSLRLGGRAHDGTVRRLAPAGTWA
ncbi:MAG: NADH-quinone oxidoreductase subunit NuoG [Armatimonadetes bacterium]|nr:NADH-quinone oxidoreductase subunit NuoG [Armatimonadota bacterium]